MYRKTGPSKWRISIFSNAPGLYSDTVPLNIAAEQANKRGARTNQVELPLNPPLCVGGDLSEGRIIQYYLFFPTTLIE